VSAPVLETRGLTRRFGGLTAVADISFSVGEGTVLGVIGPNGAGKSTLINMITGHVRPSAGAVLIGGRDLTGRRPWAIARARVARTFQIVKPFRDLSVRENVAIGSMFGPERAGSARAAIAQADAVIERVGLAGRAELRPGELSVADARRLELAKALAMRPRLLLLDEVMAGLRPGEIDAALELIRSLRQEGLTILVVEHVMRAIMSVSDTVLVVHEGRELVRGEPEEVVADPRVIEAYLGEAYARRMREARAERDGEAPDA
jgi:branched-chain amino acid transport system ATP-binding protein